MRVLLLCSEQSTLSFILQDIFKPIASYLRVYNYATEISYFKTRAFDKSGKMPRKIEAAVRNNYLKAIQENYIKVINEDKPDLIFIYNDQMLFDKTLEKINKNIKIAVFLADSPLFLQKRAHILGLIRRADVVFAPDTYWLEQCRLLGVKKSEYLIPGYNSKHHFKIEKSENSSAFDVFFMGSPYPDNWGYKRALFLSKFTGFNFHFMGPESWNEWFEHFPELKKKWILKNGYLPDKDLNKLMNKAKICPVDANPGIINGIHIRAFDCIASGVLPLIEYRPDLDFIFRGVDLEFIKNYEDIPELAEHYITNDKKRNELVLQMQEIIRNRYTSQIAGKTILKALY